jgi:hypothetical protein
MLAATINSCFSPFAASGFLLFSSRTQNEQKSDEGFAFLHFAF